MDTSHQSATKASIAPFAAKILGAALLLAMAGCAPQQKAVTSALSSPMSLEKALIEPAQVEEAIGLEKQLNSRTDEAIPSGENWFKVLPGTIPVIITAPHATRPWREGKRRFSDGGGTASLAVLLHELTGATVIYTTYEGPSDPNYDDDNAFKEQLAQLIALNKPRMVLDIHGSHAYRSYDVDVGTMNGESLQGEDKLLSDLIQRLHQDGIFSLSGNRFPAAKNATITRFSHQHGVPAIQLEINSTYVMPSSGNLEAQRFSRLAQALARYIQDISH